MTPIFHEYFCGGGMAREGLGAGWACAFANDIDPEKMRGYVANFGEHGAAVCDIADLKPSGLPGPAALAWMSPPCQDLSLAGDRAGIGGLRSNAVWPALRLVKGLRAEGRAPRTVVIENVCGWLTSGFGAVADALYDADYHAGAIEIDAALFVPQSRPRVFLVAIDKALSIPAGLTDAGPQAPFHPKMLIAACSHLRVAPIWWRLSTPPRRNSILADLIEDQPTGVEWHAPAETNRLLGMMAPIHLAKIEAAKHAGKRMVGAYFKRMRDETGGEVQRVEVRFDGVAGCLRVPAGGSSRQTIMIVDGDSVRSRLLSPRECARLMGLPDSYRLPSNLNNALHLLGDGLVAPVVRHLAAHILEPLLAANSQIAAD